MLVLSQVNHYQTSYIIIVSERNEEAFQTLTNFRILTTESETKMKFTVTSMCISRNDYMPIQIGNDNSYTKDEIIDTNTNALFEDCITEYDVEDRYEEFWNRLYGGYNNREIVKVLCVIADAA